MGRRKAAKKVVKKVIKREVAKIFKCLFCHHAKSVNCKMDMRAMTGSLKCSVCDAQFIASINTLSEPIDVFTEWLDEATEMQKEAVSGKAGGANAEGDYAPEDEEGGGRGGNGGNIVEQLEENDYDDRPEGAPLQLDDEDEEE